MKFWDFPGLSKFPKILSLKSFSTSLCNSYIPYLLLIIALRFTCGERKFGKTSKCLKILWKWLSAESYFAFYVLLTAPVRFFSSNLLYISRKRPKTNVKVFQYRILTSVKRSEKQLTSKASFNPFWNLVARILVWNCVKGLRITKIVNETKFHGIWGELEAKNCFQRQSFAKYLKQTLSFMWSSKVRESFNLYFSSVFFSINKIFILGGRLGTKL